LSDDLEKLDVRARLFLKWAEEHAAELDQRSAEYDREKKERQDREKANCETHRDRLCGLPTASLHPDSFAKPWPHPGVIIEGPVGAGKTRLAREYGLSVPRDDCIFIESIAFFELARRIDLDEASDFDRERWRALFTRRFLIFDDFGARRHTPAAEDYALQLVNARQDLTRFETIVTSNLTLAEIAAEWGNPIASRIAAFGPACRISGPDWRRRERSPGAKFLRFAPRSSPDPRDSQGKLLEDLASERPRNGDPA
jgi:DNA replication protein DnaC